MTAPPATKAKRTRPRSLSIAPLLRRLRRAQHELASAELELLAARTRAAAARRAIAATLAALAGK